MDQFYIGVDIAWALSIIQLLQISKAEIFYLYFIDLDNFQVFEFLYPKGWWWWLFFFIIYIISVNKYRFYCHVI